MDVYKLHPTLYTPTDLVEQYDSMIWTERYETPGDFELETTLVEDTLALLPEMSFISLGDTTEVMMIETHQIKKDSDGTYKLTVKGRSVDAFAEQRWLESPYNKKYKTANSYTVAEVAMLLLWNAFVNPTEQDATHPIDWFRFSTDKLPNVVVTNSVNLSIPSSRRWLEAGQMNAQLLRFLHYRRLGVRGIRPMPNSANADIITFGTGGNGLFSYDTAQTDALRFDVYNGTDRSLDQTSQTPVVFRDDMGDLEDATYLFSIADRKTVGTIASEGFNQGGIKIWDESLGLDQGASSIGWARRAMWIDGGTPDTTDATFNEWINDIVDVGQAILDEKKLVRLVDGKISPNTSHDYKVDYFLGDKVSLAGKYGATQTLRVTEYIRSQNKADGETGYPTLEVPE